MEKASNLLSLTTSKIDLGPLLSSKPNFVVFHSFEPNGRISLAHALRYALVSRIVGSMGGKYVLFVADVRASQDMYLNRDKARIEAATKYALTILEQLGVKGPHVEIVKSSEYSMSNPELFFEMVSNSIKISIKEVQDSLPPAGKKEVISASKMIAPCMHATEALFLNADLIVTPEMYAKQFDILKTFKPENTPLIFPLVDILNLKNTTPVKPDPKNYFFFEDEIKQIQQKSNGAFCTDDIQGNPVFQYFAYLLLPFLGEVDFNGKKYSNADEFGKDFPTFDKKNLKQCLAELVEKIINPIRTALSTPELSPIRDAVAKFNPSVQ